MPCEREAASQLSLDKEETWKERERERSKEESAWRALSDREAEEKMSDLFSLSLSFPPFIRVPLLSALSSSLRFVLSPRAEEKREREIKRRKRRRWN